MRTLILLFFLLLGCGPRPLTAVEPEPYTAQWSFTVLDILDQCPVYDMEGIIMTLPFTPTPFPFAGSRTMPIDSIAPEWWGDKTYRIYLRSVAWNASWLGYAQFSTPADEGLARWANGAWEILPPVDVFPFLREDTGRVYFDAKVYASGTKPAGRVTVRTDLSFWLCDPDLVPPLPELDEQRPEDDTARMPAPDLGEVEIPNNSTSGTCPDC